jgi:hypothetical protein
LASGEWFEFTEVLDCKGPLVAASHVGITREQMLPLESPIEAQLLRLWQSEPDTAVMKYIMTELGKQWRKYWIGFETRMKLLKCQYCFGYIGEGFGHPRSCKDCGGNSFEPPKKRKKRKKAKPKEEKKP